MDNNVYSVAVDFPSGMNLNLLIQQMQTVWPADVFPASYTARGRPGATGTITTGSLLIVTARALSAGEQSDALAQFQIHDPATQAREPGFLIAELPAPTTAGALVYVRDLDQQIGPGVGTMAYSNGTEWRRASDDVLVS